MLRGDHSRLGFSLQLEDPGAVLGQQAGFDLTGAAVAEFDLAVVLVDESRAFAGPGDRQQRLKRRRHRMLSDGRGHCHLAWREVVGRRCLEPHELPYDFGVQPTSGREAGQQLAP